MQPRMLILGLAIAAASLSGCCCHKMSCCGKDDNWGCGECYYSEWHNDPPACCEPCDCHGNYTGYGYHAYHNGGITSPVGEAYVPHSAMRSAPTPAATLKVARSIKRPAG